MVPVERLQSKPDILRKIRIQAYSISRIEDIGWLKIAGSAHVTHLDFSGFKAWRNFLDQPLTTPCLESIEVRINHYDFHDAAVFKEKLYSYMYRFGHSLTRVGFNVYNSKALKPIENIPLIGTFWGAISSVVAACPDDFTRLCELGICSTKQEPGCDRDWSAWKITSLEITCPPSQNLLQGLAQRATFLETLDIYDNRKVKLRKQWGPVLLLPVCTLCSFLYWGYSPKHAGDFCRNVSIFQFLESPSSSRNLHFSSRSSKEQSQF
jgi:hypothetical protein